MAHVINLAVQDFLRRLTMPNTDDHDDNSDGDDDNSGNNNNDSDNDYINNNDDDINDSAGNIKSRTASIISKLRCLITKIRSSPQKRQQLSIFCTTLQQTPKSLILDVKTRWNSTYQMIMRALELSEVS